MKKGSKIAAALGPLVLALALVSPLAAQSRNASEAADPFAPGAFEAAAGTSAGTAAGGPEGATPGGAPASASNVAKTEYLVGGSALVSASAYFPSAFDGYAASASVSGRLFAKASVPDYGSLYIAYDLSQAFLEGLGGNGASALVPPEDLGSPAYALAELHYSFDIGKALFVRIGKQLIAWGPSKVWTPVDFINPQKIDFFSELDLRQGKAGLRLHVPLGRTNVFAFADFSGLVSNGQVRDLADAADYAVRLDATLGGFELGITGFAAAEAQDKLGLDFSGDFLGMAVYGELASAPAYAGYDSWAQASFGFSRPLGDLKRWIVSGEGFYSSKGSDLEGAALGSALAQGTAVPLYVGEFYAYLALTAEELFSPDLSTSLSGLANLSDMSWTVKLSEDFSFSREVPFDLSLAFSGGGQGKEFTLLGGDDSLALTAQTRIEFLTARPLPQPHERHARQGERYPGRPGRRDPLPVEGAGEDHRRRGIERGDESHDHEEPRPRG